MKKTRSALAVLLLSISLLFSISLGVFADNYNPDEAIKYANQHWNDVKTGGSDRELCAGFVSHCLIKGGIRFSPDTDLMGGRTTYDTAFNANIYRGCWGLFHDLHNRIGFTQAYKIRTDGSGRIPWSLNSGKIAKGDLIFIHERGTTASDTDQYEHVVMVGNAPGDGQFVKIYGHNNARGNEAISFGANPDLVCMHFVR